MKVVYGPLILVLCIASGIFGAASDAEIFFKNETGVAVTIDIQRGFERIAHFESSAADTQIHRIGILSPIDTLSYVYNGPTGTYKYSLGWADVMHYGNRVLVTLTTKRGMSGVWYFEPIVSAYSAGSTGGGSTSSDVLAPLRSELAAIESEASRISYAWQPTMQQMESFNSAKDAITKSTQYNHPLSQSNFDTIDRLLASSGLSAVARHFIQRYLGVYNAVVSLGLNSAGTQFLSEIKQKVAGFLDRFVQGSSGTNENIPNGQGGSSGFKIFNPLFRIQKLIEILQSGGLQADVPRTVALINNEFDKAPEIADIRESITKSLSTYMQLVDFVKRSVAAGKSAESVQQWSAAKNLLVQALTLISARQKK